MRRDAAQCALFVDPNWNGLRRYASGITAAVNNKGVMDVDTVKGCQHGMAAYPGRGCYGDCYAAKIAAYRGFDFAVSVTRGFSDREHVATIRRIVNLHDAMWFRVGVHGDPSHDWRHTISVCKYLWPTGKTPVIVTKHWNELSDDQIKYLAKLRAVVNTSVSGMDNDAEINYRVTQIKRLREAGVVSVCRVVTCEYGDSEWARDCADKQQYLLSLAPVIDNPFRPSKTNERVLSGEIRTIFRADSIGGTCVSLHSSRAYLGACATCPDQCGVPGAHKEERHDN
jgi:hypothetical protein